ncbi:MAG: methyltransferase domain-containing protein [archaeon]
MAEEWQETYKDKTEIYEAFSKYEDEGNKVLKKLLEKCSFKDKEVLEIGCGSGKYTSLLAPSSKKYYALEISKPLINLTKEKCKKIKNIKYLNYSAEEIPLNDKSVDIVFASWVLTAMISEEMREKSIKEIQRVLKKGGDIWLFENYLEGEFMDMRDIKASKKDKADVRNLITQYKFDRSEVIDTNFFFPSLDSAKKILSFIFGNNALKYLEKHPSPKLKHKVVILHMKKA